VKQRHDAEARRLENTCTRMEEAPFKRRDELKRDLFMEDVQRDDSSVKFYTGRTM